VTNLVRGLSSDQPLASRVEGSVDKTRPPPGSSATLNAVYQGPPQSGGFESEETCKIKNILLCKKCNKKFISLGPHKKHEESCGKKLYPCDICESKFKRLQYLKLHVKKIHQDPSFVCDHPQCETRFLTKAKLHAHKKTHLVVKCSVCGKTFKSRQVLKTHKNKTHVEKRKSLGKKTWNCTQCPKVLKSVRGLLYHNKLHIVTPVEDIELEEAGDLQESVEVVNEDLQESVEVVNGETVETTNMIIDIGEEDLYEEIIADSVLV